MRPHPTVITLARGITSRPGTRWFVWAFARPDRMQPYWRIYSRDTPAWTWPAQSARVVTP